jgi:hypothetical protein
VGLATLALAVTIGPNVQLFLPRLSVEAARARRSERAGLRPLHQDEPQPAAEGA